MSRFNNYGYKKPDYQGPPIALSVKDQYGIEVFFVIKRSNKLNKLLNAYCDRQYVDINSTSFLFNGRSIRGEQTPHELQMEEGDKIHAILHRSEEQRVQHDQQLAIQISLEEEIIRRKNSKENVVDTPQSSEEMSDLDMFAHASTDAILAKDKASIVDNAAFFFSASYQSILGTPTSGKEGVSAPPVGGTAAVRDAYTAIPTGKRSKRKKIVSFQAGPSKRTRTIEKVGQTEGVSGFKLLNDDSKDPLEKDGGSHHHIDCHYAAKSSLTPEPFVDDKFVPSCVVRNNDACSDPLVCREPVRSFIPPAGKLGVARVDVKDTILKIHEHFPRLDSLLPYVTGMVHSLRGQIEAFQKKSSVLQVNAGEANVCSLKADVVGKVVKKPVKVVEKPVEHIMEKMMEKEAMEKPVEEGPSSMEKVVLTDKSVEKVEKAGEKVFQGGDTTVAPLFDVPIGGRGDGEGAIGCSLGGGDGNPIKPINVFQDANAGQGKDALP